MNVICTSESKHPSFVVSNDADELGRCAGAVGLYFLVRRCATMYLSAGNGSFGQAPYLDVHGEVDYGMRYVLNFLLISHKLT